MVVPATNSSIDVAYWYINRAEQAGVYLENEKLQHLLFISQMRYAKNYNQMFMPCVFLCGEDGFFEPNIRKMFTQGRPFMPPVKFDENINNFLESLWNEFSKLSIFQLKNLLTKSSLYKDYFISGQTNVVSWNSLVDNSAEYGIISPKYKGEKADQPKKVLLSQNGPVVVSQWTPRKINRINF